MKEQAGLIQNLLAEKSFLLIVLDACRYDAFEAAMDGYNGNIEAVHSPASCTRDWLLSQFTGEYPDITVISAHPALNSKGIPVWGFKATDHFTDIVDAWKGWDEEIGTVHPESVYGAYLFQSIASNAQTCIPRHPSKKTILWFLQPHGPWIGETKLTMPQALFLGKAPMVGNDLRIAQMVREHKIDVATLRRAYHDNLRLVLDYVRICITASKAEKIVVTADHGEMLGEDGGFLHPCKVNNEILRTVPWMQIKGDSDG